MKVGIVLFLSVFCLATPISVSAHGGGLDAKGGHYNHKTGVYHCHRCVSQKPAKRAYRSNLVLNSNTFRSDKVKTAQTMLMSLGYNIDNADGLLGPQTKKAIIKFYADNTKTSNGSVNDALILDLSQAIHTRMNSGS